MEPPSSGQAWEQLLGRTHRPGQEADEVWVGVFQHTRPFRKALQTARGDADYILRTLGGVQKLNLATFDGGAP